jgi:cyclin-dependent kinase
MRWHTEVISDNIVVLFDGDSEIDQIFKIFEIKGTPNEKVWPGITKLPDFKLTFPQVEGKGIRSFSPYLNEAGLKLLKKMIRYDPCRRISAKSAMNHVIMYLFRYILMILISLN